MTPHAPVNDGALRAGIRVDATQPLSRRHVSFAECRHSNAAGRQGAMGRGGMNAGGSSRSWRHYAALAAAIMVLQAMALAIEGHPAICKCGYVKLWEGTVNSSGNSQHLSDWYSFTHIVHGFLFYGLLFLAGARCRTSPFGARLVLAVAIEAAWEAIENTAFIIERYRAATISLDYYGDSILNSLSDTGFMIVGFVLAGFLPTSAVVALAVALELVVGWSIRDNLTLNLIMLIHPVDAIKAWQAGG
jgi:hypothetical protein